MVIVLAVALALPVAAQTVTVQSGAYADFRQLLSGEAPASTVGIAMTLRFPDERKDRYPAIVIVHTIGGYQEANEGWHAEAFRKQGFATLTYSSAAARHLRSALEPMRWALVPGKARFAAHVAYYPAGVYGAVAAPASYTGAPILMLLGEKDDNLPVAKALDYLAYATAVGIGSPFEVTIYPGAHHAWTVATLGAPKFYGRYDSTRKCPYILLRQPAPALLIGGQPVAITPDVMRTCLSEGRGYSMGYDEAVRSMSLSDMLAFLRRNVGVR